MLSLGVINEKMRGLKNWALEGSSITKDLSFKDFKESLDFTNKVGELAEKHEHHPNILIQYNKVRLTLTTHSEGGLTLKDFDLAGEIDKI